MNNFYIFLDVNNILSYIAVSHYKPENVVILISQNLSGLDEESYIRFLKEKGIETVATHTVDPYDTDKVSSLIEEKGTVILPDSRYAYKLDLFYKLHKRNLKIVYVEEDGDIFEFREGFKEVRRNSAELDVSDYINNFGGRIYESNTKLFDEDNAIKILGIIMSDLSTYRKTTRNSVPFKTDYDNQNKLDLFLSQMNEKEKILIQKIVDVLVSGRVAKARRRKNTLSLYFNDRRYKDYIAKSGTWLEHMTYLALKDVDELTDVDASVAFDWHYTKKDIRNEIDLLAVFDNRLVVISCKDTKHHDEDQLNKLVVHAEGLGLKDSIKVFAVSRKPSESILERAKELGIHVLVYSGSKDKLTKDFKKILKLSR